jgi:hypothetical protein
MRRTFLDISSQFRCMVATFLQSFQPPQLSAAYAAESSFSRLAPSQSTSSLGNMSDLLQGIFYMGVPKSRVRIIYIII